MKNLAVLITCHNREKITIECLQSLRICIRPKDFDIRIFLVDDGSQDNTSESVRNLFPDVELIAGDGNLFWAGGMRLAYDYASSKCDFDFYLLLNDDVKLELDVIQRLVACDEFSVRNFDKKGLYCSSTADPVTGNITYGASLITYNLLTFTSKAVLPQGNPVSCSLSNANILLVPKEIISKLGFFDKRYTHGIADYDFTLSATKAGFPLLLIPGIGGYCVNDHGNNWLSSSRNLRDRIDYLYSVKGLAYRENLYYLDKHFRRQRPYYIMMYWLKTFFPFIWEKFKN